MKTITYEDITIVRVTEKGLSYIDIEGIESFVDFNQCNANFLETMEKAGDRVVRLDLPEFESVKYVGFRDFSGPRPYIELLTDPPTRFEFARPPRPCTRVGTKFIVRTPSPSFLELRTQLDEAGAATIDLA